jgi:integrase/recombinase XerD
MNTPVVRIYVRHADGCKYEGDEYTAKCGCRKWFRWTDPTVSWVDGKGNRHQGKQYRQSAGTRSWAEAEENKAALIAKLTGREPTTPPRGQMIQAAVDVFLQDKKNQEVTPKVLAKYRRELARLRSYCEGRGVFVVSGLTKELLTGYAATWPEIYPASSTRSRVRDRLSTFLRYCYQAEWLPRVPKLSPVKVEQSPTMPLTPEEYAKLLDTTYATFADESGRGARVRALIQLMRYSGLAIRDALTLRRDEITHDKGAGLYLIVTSRQKTGTHVAVPIPPDVAQEILAVANGNPVYVFWSGNGDEESATKNWAKYLARLFDDAEITSGHMRSHRLRDTFAVDLLSKGVPMEEVSKLLGHDSIKTTEKSYARWAKTRQDRLNSLVTATWKK